MKLLIYSLNYFPEPTGTGKVTGEMVDWLARSGHYITVIAAPPHYPTKRVALGYSKYLYKRENIDGIRVFRCPIIILNNSSGISRMLSQLSFAISSFPVLVWLAIWRRYDLIWTVIPPISGLPGALFFSWLLATRSWLHVQDFEVDAAFELGLFRNKWMRLILLKLESILMSRFDVVSSISERMLARLKEKIPSRETFIFPNWTNISDIFPSQKSTSLQMELGIEPGAFVALYSGNLGEKQGVAQLIQVASLVRRVRPDLVIVICGDGVGRERLQSVAEGEINVLVRPLQPRARLNELLNIADVHLLPQRAEIGDLVLPSKLGGMLASGRPVIVGAAAGTQLAEEVAGCGIVVPPGDPFAMASALLQLAENPDLRAQMGERARGRAMSHWGREEILTRFETELMRLVRRTSHISAAPQ